MKLLNFSVGRVQTIEIGGESIRTAYVKTPVAEPWIVTPQGARGDERAVHPDKIYAYARSSYDYWAEYLNTDPAWWPDGFFGENLTFDVLEEAALRIGDVYALGDEVRLVVAGPRNPCAKLSWRLEQPPTFQKIFQQSGHTGVYFGVLNAGTLRPGDIAQRLHRDPSMPTVVEAAGFAAGHAVPPLEPLRRLLAFEHLSGTIRHVLHAKLESAERAAAAVEGRWKGWRAFRIERIVEETPDVRSAHLRPTDRKRLCQPRPGQFVSVRMQDTAGKAITRTWSLSSFGPEMDSYRISVRRQAGAGSRWMHQAQAGATVMLRAPAGDFVLDLGAFRPVVMIAAGIGITPLLAMLHAHLARGPAAAPIFLVYGARTPAELAFRAELDALSAAHPSLHITYVYSRSDAAGRPAGRITPKLILGVLSDLHVMLEGGRRIPLPWFEHDAYICGPGDFCQTIKSQLVDRGANPDCIFLENFSTPAPESSDLDTAQIKFLRSGITCVWNADEDLTLLEVAENCGVATQSDCRAGACLTCKTAVIAGETTVQTGDGSTLLCIGRPKTRVVVLDR